MSLFAKTADKVRSEKNIKNQGKVRVGKIFKIMATLYEDLLA